MTRRSIAIAFASLFVVAACAGPEPRVDFAGKAVPINVAFGKPGPKDPGAPPPTADLVPVPAGVGVVPVVVRVVDVVQERTTTTRKAAPAPCPDRGPLTFSSEEAPEIVRTLAPEGTYPFRINGYAVESGKRTDLAGTVDVKVGAARSEGEGRSSFTLTYAAGGATSAVAYAVTAPASIPGTPNNAGADTGSIALRSITSSGNGTSPASFSPPKPLRLIPLRPARGATFRDATNDPTSGSTATVEGLVVDKLDDVNACGTPVQAWKVQITQRMVTPFQDITSEQSIWFATQYGGLPVKQVVKYNGAVGPSRQTPVSGETVFEISEDPKR